MKRKFAFTLAELIIGITVIGILTAVTVPSMIRSHQKHGEVALLKNVYTDLGDNLNSYKSEQGINAILTFNQSKVQNFVQNNFDVIKTCSTTSSCFSAYYKSLSGVKSEFSKNGGYGAVLKNGVAMYIVPETVSTTAYSRVCLGSRDSDCYMNYDAFSNNKLATVYIDVNGEKLPNLGGRDMFTFNIYGDFSIDEVSPSVIRGGTAITARNTLYSNNCTTSATGVGCFGKILNDNWEMNY